MSEKPHKAKHFEKLELKDKLKKSQHFQNVNKSVFLKEFIKNEITSHEELHMLKVAVLQKHNELQLNEKKKSKTEKKVAKNTNIFDSPIRSKILSNLRA